MRMGYDTCPKSYPSGQSTSLPTSMKTRIAIVEDEPMLREELAFQLRHMGFSVNTFENAQQFYRWLAVEKFDVVILDIGLAGEDGLSICAHLREHDRDVVLI